MADTKRFTELNEKLLEVQDDLDKFYNKGNKTAGTRIRKAMQDLKVLAQDIRVEVQQIKTKD